MDWKLKLIDVLYGQKELLCILVRTISILKIFDIKKIRWPVFSFLEKKNQRTGTKNGSESKSNGPITWERTGMQSASERTRTRARMGMGTIPWPFFQHWLLPFLVRFGIVSAPMSLHWILLWSPNFRKCWLFHTRLGPWSLEDFLPDLLPWL